MMPFFKIVLLYFPCAVGWWFIGVILVALSINTLCRISPKFAVWCYTHKQRKEKQKMNETVIANLLANLVRIEGVSKKTNKPYKMYKLTIDTEEFGEVDIVLDTRTDRAGIVLAMLDRKEART